MVYAYVLPNNIRFRRPSMVRKPHKAYCCSGGVNIDPLLVSKQFSAEATKVFHSNNIFILWGSPSSEPRYFALSNSKLKQMNHIEITILALQLAEPTLDRIASAWKGLEGVKSLKILFELHKRQVGASVASFKKLLEPLTTLKGMKQVDI